MKSPLVHIEPADTYHPTAHIPAEINSCCFTAAGTRGAFFTFPSGSREYYITLQQTNHFLWLYLLEGNLKFLEPGIGRMPAKTFRITTPHSQPQRFKLLSRTPAQFLLLSLPATRFSSFLQRNMVAGFGYFTSTQYWQQAMRNSLFVLRLSQWAVINQLQENTRKDRAITSTLQTDLHWLMADSLLQVMQALHEKEPANGEEKIDSLALAMFYLMVHYDQPFHLATLAKLAGTNPARLEAAFKSAYGMSAARFLQKIRMENAKVYLRETGMPVREIALRLGFSNAAHFSAAFRSYTGYAPTVYKCWSATNAPSGSDTHAALFQNISGTP